MKNSFVLYLSLILCNGILRAQQPANIVPGAFERITAEVQEFKMDTSAAPDDRITRKIIELRKLRGGFNINEAISFKIQEEEKKKELPPEKIQLMKEQFENGRARTLLDNATIWIYRNQFTYKELKQMVRFYKRSAGQKLANQFPVIMLQTMMVAQTLQERMMK
jgi:hypothetical protein